MIDAYDIGASITLDPAIFGQMDVLAGRFDGIEATIGRINAMLREMGGAARAAASGATAMASAWSRAAGAAERAARAMASAGGGGGGGGGFYGDGAGGAAGGAAGGGGRGGGGGGGRNPIPESGYGDGFTFGPARRDVPFNNGPVPLSMGGSSGGHVDPLLKAFGEYEVTRGVTHLVRNGYDNAAGVSKQEAALRLQNLTPAQVAGLQARAVQMQRTIPGVSIPGALDILADSYNITRNYKQTLGVSGELGRDAVVLAQTGHADMIPALFQALQSAEKRGLMNKNNPNGSMNLGPFSQYMDLLTRVAMTSNGRFSPGAMNTIGINDAGFKYLSNPALMTAALLSEVMSPERVGVGLNAFNVQFQGGKMNQAQMMLLREGKGTPEQQKMLAKQGLSPAAYHAMVGLGLVNTGFAIKSGLAQYDILQGGIKGGNLAATDPFAWMRKYLFPAAEKKDPGDPLAVIRSIYQDLSRMPAQRLAIDYFNSMHNLDRQRAAVNASPSVNRAFQIQQETNGALAFNAFGNSLGGLVFSLADPMMKTAMANLKALTGDLNSVAAFMNRHPAVAKGSARGVVAVGAASFGAFLFGLDKLVGSPVAGAASRLWKWGSKFGPAEKAELDKVGSAATASAETPYLAALSKLSGILTVLSLASDTMKLNAEQTQQMIAANNAMDAGKPIPVHVVNGHDLASGVTRHQADQAHHMPTGPVAPNNSVSMPYPGWMHPAMLNP